MTTQRPAREFPGFPELLFEEPLYTIVKRPTPEQLAAANLAMVQGYCPKCKEERAFRCVADLSSVAKWRNLERNPAHVELRCVWDETHRMHFYIQLTNGTLEKVGQTPSFATIAQGADKECRKLMSQEDATEFVKAIGLASHDTGIGAFVYIRRIFERTIHRCFDEHKGTEGWTDDQYNVRMDDRIQLMARHLPSFIVENRRLYGILSKAVHELDEEECLSFFPIARDSIIQILRDEKRQREEAALKRQLQAEIGRFQSEA